MATSEAVRVPHNLGNLPVEVIQRIATYTSISIISLSRCSKTMYKICYNSHVLARTIECSQDTSTLAPWKPTFLPLSTPPDTILRFLVADRQARSWICSSEHLVWSMSSEVNGALAYLDWAPQIVMMGHPLVGSTDILQFLRSLYAKSVTVAQTFAIISMVIPMLLPLPDRIKVPLQADMRYLQAVHKHIIKLKLSFTNYSVYERERRNLKIAFDIVNAYITFRPVLPFGPPVLSQIQPWLLHASIPIPFIPFVKDEVLQSQTRIMTSKDFLEMAVWQGYVFDHPMVAQHGRPMIITNLIVKVKSMICKYDNLSEDEDGTFHGRERWNIPDGIIDNRVHNLDVVVDGKMDGKSVHLRGIIHPNGVVNLERPFEDVVEDSESWVGWMNQYGIIGEVDRYRGFWLWKKEWSRKES